ncbi:scramblase [Flavobacterium branchiophilum]|uniref:Uncharacterized protein YxjI n=1 Tax=Flavobacterium branchiophilum TaxID=55197 RepID=A0A543G688_9FLAO|nr:phospholipid scramblase-related protein [Flavobacterium branchiophilum]OXA80240.1 scramblase [Flavobacterium branchiophilum] [Flavobacterium branchiophilum NBRC 15030 = ATCC 35035]TQM41606.1 uncharacterized protein YxjI [Flavobacterium branchiophilum]GEM55636.1 RNAse [Flavobacterium branchiophilum NBRC 15030 = ATCC 35035]
MQTHFFDTNHYFIDEKVQFFKFENSYKIYNEHGDQIGIIKQKLSFGQKMLQLIINKAMMPFELEITDNQGQIVASISRGWTFWMSKIMIKNQQGNEIGMIKQKFKLFKPKFMITDLQDTLIAEISGDWKAWEFNITDPNNENIGSISKKWNGMVKELFTSADKYKVEINPNLNHLDHKVAIIASAITIDMVLKERK